MMCMQETAVAALAHSCSCRLALIEDVTLAAAWLRLRVGAALEELNRERGAGKDRLPINLEDLRNSALIGHLVRLADRGRFRSKERGGEGQAYGRVPGRMKRDIEVGLDNPYNDLATESLRPMKEDEMSWFEPPSVNVTEAIAAADTEEDDLLPTGVAVAATDAVAELDAEGNGEELPPLPLALFLGPRGHQPFTFLSSHPGLTSSLTSSSLNTSSTMSSISMSSSWSTKISTVSIS